MSEYNEDDDFFDDLPVKEAPASLCRPREMSFLYGHEKIEDNLVDLFSRRILPHAVIFAGPRGIGKATAAFRLARFLLSGGKGRGDGLAVPPQDKVFHQVAASGHPDLLGIEKPEDKNTLPVEEARKVAPFLRLTSSGGGWRVAIVDDADTMNRNAQNALLKILEEPPPDALLILIAHRPGALVPTIRSRCRMFTFRRLDNGNMLKVLNHSDRFRELEPSARQSLMELAGGSPGIALQYLENGSIEVYETAMDIINATSRTSWARVHQLADTLASGGNDKVYLDFQNLLVSRLQATAKARATGRDEGRRPLLPDCSLADIVKICENLEQYFVQANTANLDKRQVVLGAMSILRKMKEK